MKRFFACALVLALVLCRLASAEGFFSFDTGFDAESEWFEQSAIDVFEFDRLSMRAIFGTDSKLDGDHQQFHVHLHDDHAPLGSEGYWENWVTDEGVLADMYVDLDGDGKDEYLTYEIIETDENNAFDAAELVVYETDGTKIAKADSREVSGLKPMGENGIKVIATPYMTYIWTYYIGWFDGGTIDCRSVLYKYDGEKLETAQWALASNTSLSCIVDCVDTAQPDEDELMTAIDAYMYKEDSQPLEKLGFVNGGNMILMDTGASLDLSAFEKLNGKLKNYSAGVIYKETEKGYFTSVSFDGGSLLARVKDFQYDRQDRPMTAIEVCSTLDHRPVMFEEEEEPEMMIEPGSKATPISDYDGNLFADASSYFTGNSTSVAPSKMIDGKASTSWDSYGEYEGAWVSVGVTDGEKYMISGFSIINGKGNGSAEKYWKRNSRVKDVSVYVDGVYVQSFTVKDHRDYQTFVFDAAVMGSTVKLVIDTVYEGKKYPDHKYGVCIAELSLF